METLALAITDSVRTQPYGAYWVPGTIWESIICTKFKWPWICFPAALMVLSATVYNINVHSQRGRIADMQIIS
jgi:hypothetical protein